MELFCKGTLEDRADIIDFGNYVFGYDHEPHDYPTLVPRLYADGQHTEENHYLIKEDGKIKALVCAFPMKWMAGEIELKLSFIGTVSVHPYARGRGYMKRLMAEAINDMRKEGCHFTALGGQRQRYRYYGYELGGTGWEFNFNHSNLRHSFGEVIPLEVRPLEEQDAAKGYPVYQKRAVRGVRSAEEFFLMLHNWNSKPYGLYKGDVFVGYAVINGKSIQELVLETENDVLAAIKGLMLSLAMEKAELMVPDYEQERILRLADVCEEYVICPNESYLIFDYVTVIRAYLQIKAGYRILPDGEICLGLGGKNITISVKDGCPDVAETPENSPVLTMNDPQAAAFLLAQLSPKRMSLRKAYPFLDAWFPLPIFIDNIDAC